MNEIKLLNAKVTGKVQGVGFRYFVQSKAEKLGLTGYAKNMPDGSVEIEVEGDEEHIVALLKDIAKGPEKAEVREMTHSIKPHVGKFSTFRVL